MIKDKFYTINLRGLEREESSKVFGESDKALLGKNVKFDLSALARGKLGEVTGKISEVKGNAAFADPTGMKLYPSYVKRFVRRGVSKVDESFIVENADKKKFRVKPTLITRKRVKRSVETALRKETRDFLAKQFAGEKTEEMFNEILNGETQKKLSKRLKKIYPLSFCEICEIKLEKKK